MQLSKHLSHDVVQSFSDFASLTQSNYSFYVSSDWLQRDTEITDLLRACLVALRVPEEVAALFRVRPLGLWKTAEALDRIQELLARRPAGGELADFLPIIEAADPSDRDRRRRAAVASTLVASLELARRGTITVQQDGSMASPSLRLCAPMPASGASLHGPDRSLKVARPSARRSFDELNRA